MVQESPIRDREGSLQLYLDVCREIAKNTAMWFPQVRAWRLRRPRAFTEFKHTDEDLERYAFLGLRSLQRVLGSLMDRHIVEVGPGDFMTSGLAMLAAGAASYTVIDRFVGDYSKPEAKEWYRAVHEIWPRLFPELPWPEYLNVENFPEGYPDRAKVMPVPIEEAQATRRFDVVCSYQVGEHVNSIEAFAEMNARLLAPDGVGVHRVDFGPHDCWFYYKDPLVFLRFPDWLWSLMGSNRGTPNRRRYHEFQSAWKNAGLTVDDIGRELIPEDQIKDSRLARKFRSMPSDSIATGTAIFVCRLNPALERVDRIVSAEELIPVN